MLKPVASFYPCWLNDGKDLIYNEVVVQNLYVGIKEDYKEFRTDCLLAKNRKVTLVNTKLHCSHSNPLLGSKKFVYVEGCITRMTNKADKCSHRI